MIYMYCSVMLSQSYTYFVGRHCKQLKILLGPDSTRITFRENAHFLLTHRNGMEFAEYDRKFGQLWHANEFELQNYCILYLILLLWLVANRQSRFFFYRSWWYHKLELVNSHGFFVVQEHSLPWISKIFFLFAIVTLKVCNNLFQQTISVGLAF